MAFTRSAKYISLSFNSLNVASKTWHSIFAPQIPEEQGTWQVSFLFVLVIRSWSSAVCGYRCTRQQRGRRRNKGGRRRRWKEGQMSRRGHFYKGNGKRKLDTKKQRGAKCGTRIKESWAIQKTICDLKWMSVLSAEFFLIQRWMDRNQSVTKKGHKQIHVKKEPFVLPHRTN